MLHGPVFSGGTRCLILNGVLRGEWEEDLPCGEGSYKWILELIWWGRWDGS